MITLYSFARLFLMRRIDDMKYIPMISDRKRTTLVVEPLPTLHNICQETSNRYDNQHPDKYERYIL
jgi:hypothetical protein